MIFRFLALGLGTLAVSLASAQIPSGEVDLKTSVGSLKINSPGKEKARGRIQMSFRGTLLLSDYKGATPIVTGTFRKEYDNAQGKRTVYYGKGTITLDGNFRAIQWFGSDLNMKWIGMGICRLFGEFDKAGKTGTYQVKGDLVRYWGSGGTTFSIPNPVLEQAKAPIIKRGG
jgi:hypothetical protein